MEAEAFERGDLCCKLRDSLCFCGSWSLRTRWLCCKGKEVWRRHNGYTLPCEHGLWPSPAPGQSGRLAPLSQRTCVHVLWHRSPGYFTCIVRCIRLHAVASIFVLLHELLRPDWKRERERWRRCCHRRELWCCFIFELIQVYIESQKRAED